MTHTRTIFLLLLAATAHAALADSSFRFVPATVTVPEALGASATLAIVRSGDLSSPAAVDVYTEDDSAKAGFHYAALSNTVAFAAGDATNTVAIPILDNGVYQTGTIDFFVRLANPTGATLGSPANATVVIQEDDVATWSGGPACYLYPAGGAWTDDSEDDQYWNLDDDRAYLAFASGSLVTAATFADADPDAVFSPLNAFVYLQGGTSGFDDLAAFLAENTAAAEAWVRAGGRLLVSASPPDAASACALPFGAVLQGGVFSDATSAPASTNDALFTAYCPVGPNWAAASGHHTANARLDLSGATVAARPRLLGADGAPLVATAALGAGRVTWSALCPGQHFRCERNGIPGFFGFFALANLALVASDVADPLYVTECPVFEIAGIVGDLGSFSPTGKVYSLENWSSSDYLAFEAAPQASWLAASPADGILPPGHAADVILSVTPAVTNLAVGAHTSSLVVQNLGSGRENHRLVRVTVLPVPGHLAPVADTALAFGDVALGTSATNALLLANTDAEHAVILHDATFAGRRGFACTNAFPLTIAPASSAAVGVVFTPLSAGPHTDTLTLSTNDPDLPSLSLSLSGTGYVKRPVLAAAPTSFVFTNLVGETSVQTLTLSNLPAANQPLSYRLHASARSTPIATAAPQKATNILKASPKSPVAGLSSHKIATELLVRFATPVSTPPTATATKASAKRSTEEPSSPAAPFRIVRPLRTRPDTAVVAPTDGASLDETAAALLARPDVVSVQPNYRYHALAVPDDPSFPSQWALRNTSSGIDIGATNAWDIARDASSVIVAVIDSGADLDHPDLADNLWTNPGEIPGNGIDDDGNGYIDDVHGYDFFGDTGTPEDDNSHGTHCCGIIGAVGNNGTGVCGVCWRVRLMPLKFLDSTGHGDTADAIDAIRYAVANGASVISASWGGDADIEDPALEEAIEEAGAAGVLFVCAAGNDGKDLETSVVSPACFPCDNLLTVVNHTRNGALSASSNYGALSAHLAAPGTTIYSTVLNGGYGNKSGTSMACPHVSGAAALVRSVRPDLSATEVRSLLLATATPRDALAGKCSSGASLDLAEALRSATAPDLWLSASPTNGTLSVGASADIAVTASADGLAAGTYTGSLALSSNDPDTPSLDLPVTMVVLPPSRITDAAWRARYGLPDDDSADNLDLDDDGFSYYEEWLLGTIPTDPASTFRITAIEPEGTGVRVTWTSVPGRAYSVLSADALTSPFAALATDLPADTGSTTSYLDAAPPPARFYRIGLSASPVGNALP